MKWFLDKKIGTKLILAFVAVLALTSFLGIFSLMKLTAVRATTVDMAENWLPSVRTLGAIEIDAGNIRRLELRAALAKTDQDRADQRHAVESAEGVFQVDQAKFESMISGPDEKKLYDAIAAAYDDYKKSDDQAQQLFNQGEQAEAADFVFETQKTQYDLLASALEADIGFDNDGATKADKLSTELYSTARAWAIGVLFLCVLLGLALAVWMSNLISRPVEEAVVVAKRIAAGDLTARDIPVRCADEVGELSRAINDMKNSLRETIISVSSGAERIATASEELSASASQQAAGAETQKDQTHQVATAMHEMSSTVQQVSENSNKASEASRKAADTARHGGEIVEDTLSKMRAIADSVGHTAKKVQELGKSSNQIGEIIGVIDDIADQTNLLALNAAIEAARAGEQGRGFAVVADEVRKLAERTSKATKEITQMIQSIQTETKSAVEAMESGTKQVELGVESTTQAGTSLHEIIKTSEQVGDMVMLIATAATQQASASDEINGNIEQIAKITQETAAGAGESAKAIHELSNLATDLQTLVSKFKTTESKGKSSGRRTKPAARPRPVAKARVAEEQYEQEAVGV